MFVTLEREGKNLYTHPRSISKYVFTRMHAAGRNGTNGQMKPGRGKKSNHIILLDLPIAYCLHIGIYFIFLMQFN